MTVDDCSQYFFPTPPPPFQFFKDLFTKKQKRKHVDTAVCTCTEAAKHTSTVLSTETEENKSLAFCLSFVYGLSF